MPASSARSSQPIITAFLCLVSVAEIAGDDIRYVVHGEEFEINCSLATSDPSVAELSWEFMDGTFDAGLTQFDMSKLINTLQFTVDASIHGGMITCIENMNDGTEHSRDSITIIGMNHNNYIVLAA